MYTSILIFGIACFFSKPSAIIFGLFSILLCVLFVKARLEEHWLCEKFPSYDAYMKTTGRFLPIIF